MLRALAPLLLKEGYVLRVFDLIDPQHSDAFNPFSYIRDAKDVMKLVNNLIQNTTPKKRPAERPVLGTLRGGAGHRPDAVPAL